MPVNPDIEALWDYGDPVGSEARFQAQLDDAAVNPDLHAELLTQIARAQGLQRRFADAHRTLDTVQACLPGDTAGPEIRYWLERGRVYNSSGAPGDAVPCFQQAWDAARAAGEDFYAVDAAHMLAIVTSGPEQMAWNLAALQLAEQSPQPRARQWLGALYNNIGWSDFDRGAYDAALAQFARALAWRQSQGQTVETRIAQWCVARTLRALGRIDEALSLQLELETANAADGRPDGYVYEEIGECLLATGRTAEARDSFARAYALLAQDAWLVANEAERLARLAQLGQGGAGGNPPIVDRGL